MKVAVSYLKSDDYKACIKMINSTSADYLHVDMCDGRYVESKNFTIGELNELLKISTKPLDVHLMVEDPDKYIDKLAMLNTETITFHKNGSKNPLGTIEHIKSVGLKVGMAINPDENIDSIKDYINIIDEVLVMSVVPGKGGQKFMPEVLATVEKLKELKPNYHYIIAMDGGINGDTINEIKNYNIDLIISGSYITCSDNFEESIGTLR